MAMIREKREFRISPIGVARSSSAGQITGEAIARSAAKAEAVAYKRAVEDADKRGVDLANALSRQQIVSLNPKTGVPDVYQGPEGLGRVAQRAYQKVLLTRFEQEIGNQIDGKMKELALKYDLSPSGFNKAASDYIAQMANTETSTVFSNEILRVGDAVRQNLHTTLRSQQVTRERAAQYDAYLARTTDSLQAIEAHVAANGKLEADDQALANLILSAKQGDKDVVNAQLTTEGKVSINESKRQLAIARGLLRFELKAAASNINISHLDYVTLKNAVDAQRPDLIPDSFGQTKQVLSTLMAEPSLANSFSEFANELIGDSVVLSTATLDENLRNAFIASQTGDASAVNLAKTTSNIASGNPTSESYDVDFLINSYNADRSVSLAAIQEEGISAEAASIYTESSRKKIEAVVDGYASKILTTASSVEELTQLQLYLKTGGSGNISEDLQPIADTLLELSEGTGLNEILTKVDTFIDGATSEKGFIERKQLEENNVNLINSVSEILNKEIRLSGSSDDIESAYASTLKQINSSGASKGEKIRQKSILKNETADALVRLAFNTVPSATANLELAAYAKGNSSGENLPPETKALVDKAKDTFDDLSSFRTSVNNYKEGTTNRLTAEASSRETQEYVQDIKSRIVDPTDSDAQDIADKLMGVDDSWYFTQPDMEGSAKYSEQADQEKFASISKSILPSAFITVLETTSNGAPPRNASFKRMLSLYENSITVSGPQGVSADSNSITGLSDDARAFWDELSAYAKTTGANETEIARYAAKFQQSKTSFTNKAFQLALGDAADQKTPLTPEAYVTKIIPQSIQSKEVQSLLVAETRAWFIQSSMEGEYVAKDLNKRLKDKFERIYVQDEDILYEFGESATLYPLRRTVGDGNGPDLFKQYIRNQLTGLGDGQNWEDKEFKLQPVGRNVDGGMTYGVFAKENGEYVLVHTEVSTGPVTPPTQVPAFFSTSESEFLSIMRQERRRVQAEAISEAEADIMREKVSRESPLGSEQSRKNIKAAIDEIPLLQNFPDLDEDTVILFNNLPQQINIVDNVTQILSVLEGEPNKTNQQRDVISKIKALNQFAEGTR